MSYFNQRLSIDWQILELLHKLACKFLNYLSYIISEFGSGIAIFGILIIIYYLVDKKKARMIGLIVGPSMLVNNILKGIIAAKRPFEFEGKSYLRKFSSDKMDGATGSSFPSGHAQVSSAFYTNLFINFKKIWIRIVSIVLIILIALSRLYLGVHFPGDVLIGLILGIGLTILLHFLYTKIEDKKWKYFIYLIPLVITIPFLIIYFNNALCADLFKTFGFASAFTLSMFVEEKYIKFKEDVPFKNKIARLLISASLGLIIYLSKLILPDHNFFHFLRYFFVALTSFMIVPFFFKKEGQK